MVAAGGEEAGEDGRRVLVVVVEVMEVSEGLEMAMESCSSVEMRAGYASSRIKAGGKLAAKIVSDKGRG